MTDMRDATWRFINMAPIVGNQTALDDLFAEALKPFGVDRFDCGRVPGGDETEFPVFLSGRGMSDWEQYYFDQRYSQTDPSPMVCKRFSGAYTWSAVRSLAEETTRHQIWADARAGGMREGLIVPMWPRRLTEAVVRLITPEDHFQPESIPLMQSISVIYASSTASFGSASAKKKASCETDKSLTRREIECLHWAARGKTNSEIGVIVNISRHTVNTHIESAKRKLGVGTRVQAAALAHTLGILSIA